MNEPRWLFSIDVGGTFTDVVAHAPDGELRTLKLLSSGVHRGIVQSGSTTSEIIDPRRNENPVDFWRGYTLRVMASTGAMEVRRVRSSNPFEGRLALDTMLNSAIPAGTPYELQSGEEAPVAAIRRLMGLRLDEPVGKVEVRLGTTRATNSLLERKGARTLFVTTKGFADVLRIGYQDRPKLFDLHVCKRDEIFEDCLEIDERLDAEGQVILEPNRQQVQRELARYLRDGFEAAAICLLHAHVNPAHEELVAAAAAEVGFPQVSVSSRVARLERIVPRGDTTVADAYLGRVIHSYVEAIKRSIPTADVLLMNSNGGLIPANRVHGKDTILSGPAGGVVGCAAVARQAGFEKVIGFDMGGTSTDVCRIDGPLEYQHETVKAGVRLMTPMLAIETVAAGGGSLCTFDGQKLVVGPHSAGADPGPACYGRGGPLTVTDMNMYVGRLVADRFPFPLDRGRVERLLTDLSEQIRLRTGSARTPIELACGFLAIADDLMASAIKRISIARGYDLREYSLVSFGGAGGQHVCAISRALGVRQALLSPLAGVLSAFGISRSVMKRIVQRSERLPWTNANSDRLHALSDELSAEAYGALVLDGMAHETPTERSVTIDVCYAGQSTFLTIAANPPDTVRARFEADYLRLYGYIHAERPIEIRVVRVELAASVVPGPGRLGPLTVADQRAPIAPSRQADGHRAPMSDCEVRRCALSTEHQIYTAGQWTAAPLRERNSLLAGEVVLGPAVIVEDHSTIVVDPGWTARRLSTGDLLLTDEGIVESPETIGADADPIQLELFHNRFAAIAEQMGATLRRTALSVNVKERLDFSCAVFDASGALVANAPHIPVHLGGMSECIRCLIEDVASFGLGEVYVTNDPYRGGSHLNDVTVVTPVHDAAGRIVFFVANRAHHAEIGGKRPGSMPPDSTCLADEGVLVRAFPIVRAGQFQVALFRSLLNGGPYPSRCPDENVADLAAQIAANQTGVGELRALVERYGLGVVHAYMGHIQRAAENKVRRALARHGSGTYHFRDSLDDGSPICVAISIGGDGVRFDFTGTGPVHRGNLNANRAIVTSAIIYCLRCLLDDDLPLNAGVLAPVEIVLPTCLLNPPANADPQKCPAMVGGNVETSQRVVDVILGALGLVAGSQGTMNNLLMGNTRFGYYETICGGAGAGPGFHGADAVHTHMTNTRLTDPEVLESRYPVRLIRFAIRRGSGGAGRFHGGCGVVREIEFIEPLEVSILSQRRLTVPYGLVGGASGAAGRNTLQRAGSNSSETLAPVAHVFASPGDRITIETPGGGGYGAPE